MSDVFEVPEVPENLSQCEHCSAEVSDALIFDVDGEAWCRDCAENSAHSCDECGELFRSNSMYTVENGYRHNTLSFCQVCYETTTFSCGACGTDWTDGSCSYSTADGTVGECCVSNYTFCDICGADVDEGCDCDSSRHGINNYGYKPNPIFHPSLPPAMRRTHVGMSTDPACGVIVDYEGKRIDRSTLPQFGIELEVECDTFMGRDNNAVYMANEFDTSELYLKEDGSLSMGFEIVTHPRSLDSWREFASGKFGEALEGLRQNDVRAWDNRNCGLHIHVSRIAFNGRPHLARFALLFGENETEWVRVAGRRTSYANFDSLRNGGLVKKAMFRAGNHMDAVNFSPRETVEVRIWRPSLKVNRVIASIEFCHAALEYTRNITVADVANGALDFRPFSKFVMNHDYPMAQRVLGGETFRNATEGA